MSDPIDLIAKRSPIHAALLGIYQECQGETSGNIASYIPELAKADPQHFGLCIVTTDGMVYEVGNTREFFTMQSISKVFVYGLALTDHGQEEILRHIGVEPSGEVFNSITFDENSKRPFNPMVNTGAIATTALIKGSNYQERLQRILDTFERFTGHPMEVDQKVFLSEKMTGHRNRAIAYLELNNSVIKEPLEEHLDLYFTQCSLLVNARDLAVMAATLANHGINPVTGVKAQEPEYTCRMLSVMQSCGMYNFSGEWIFRVGLPAKSGVSGGVLALAPGLLGIGVYSPRLDINGNSIRGVKTCEALSKTFNLHMFGVHPPMKPFIRRFYTGAQVQSLRRRNQAEISILWDLGECISIFELQGDMFFSAVEQPCRRLATIQANALYVIFDCRYIDRVDPCTSPILTSLFEILKDRDTQLYIINPPEELTNLLDDEMLKCCFNDLDEILEKCENHLISLFFKTCDEGQAKQTVIPLSDIDIMKTLFSEEQDVLEQFVTLANYHAGEIIIKDGSEATELFMLASGVASIYVRSKVDDATAYKRVGAISQGVSFGELSFFDGGNRTANIIAEEDCVCYVLTITQFKTLAQQYPRLHSKILVNVGKALSERLRQSNDRLRD